MRFTADVLTRIFRSHDLGLAAANLRRDRSRPELVLDEIDEEKVLEYCKILLEIIEKEDQKVAVDDRHAAEIKEYLELLDLVAYVDLVDISFQDNSGKLTVLTQPGLRYAQATALIDSLFRDERIMQLPAAQRLAVKKRVLQEISGRMMEEIVLLETKLARPDCEVFKLQFAVGEFDMVVFDPNKIECELYEIEYKDLLPDSNNIFKGMLSENYVFQEFCAKNKPVYFFKKNDSLEVDLLIESEGHIIPAEIKSGRHKRSTSLKNYITAYAPPYAIRISANNFGNAGEIKQIPLYAVFCIADE